MPQRRRRRDCKSLDAVYPAVADSPQGMERERFPRFAAPLLDLRLAELLEQAGQRFANMPAVGRQAAPQVAHDPAARALDHLLANLKRRFAAEAPQRIGL